MLNLKQTLLSGGLGLALLAGPIGCESNAGTGALVGGAAGAGLGAIIGHNSHGRTAEGALIGGAAGAIGGAVIGNEMDKNEARDRDRVVDERYDDEAPPPPPPPAVEGRVYVDPHPHGHWVIRRYITPSGRVYERRYWVDRY